MRALVRAGVALVAVVCAAPVVAGAGAAAPRALAAQEAWRAEFDDICAKTQDAMALSSEELQRLVERCDKLMPEIEKLDESRRKVYTSRLQACRKLYVFVLETRDKSS